MSNKSMPNQQEMSKFFDDIHEKKEFNDAWSAFIEIDYEGKEYDLKRIGAYFFGLGFIVGAKEAVQELRSKK